MRSLILACSVLFACGDNHGVQQISGQLDQSTFSTQIDAVHLISSRGVYSKTPIGSDGEFVIHAPEGGRYRIVFAASDLARSKLVFPRSTGVIDQTFRVHRNMSPIDLRLVRYVGDPAGTPFIFTCSGDTDPNGMCVEDDGEGQGGIDEMQGDNNQCGDNEDEDENDDGENENDDDDGDDMEMEDDDGQLDDDAAVAQTNIESDVGCHDDEGDDEDEGEGEGGEEEDDDDLAPLPKLTTSTVLR